MKKKLTKKQKRIFVEPGDMGFDCLDPSDFKDTELGELLSTYIEIDMKLNTLFDTISEELDD